MGFLSGIAKYLLFFFNFLIVLCAIILIAIGGVIIAHENKGIDGFTDYSVGGFAIGVGVIIFIIAFFGCCGAIKEHSCMLTTYAVILILLLILQLVLGILAFVSIKNDDKSIDKEIKKNMEDIFNKYNNSKDNKTEVVDDIQRTFECCGVEDYTFWGTNIPNSCYEDVAKPNSLYKTGCVTAFRDFITYFIKVIGGVAIAFAIIELVGAAFACIVRNRS